MNDMVTSDPFLRAAFWIGIAAVGLIAALVLQIIAMRVNLRARERRNAAVIARWRPILTAVLADVRPRALPPLEKHEETDFLRLWLHFQSSLRGEARASLNWLAEQLGCEHMALRMLHRGHRGEQLLAVLALGHLGHAEAFAALQTLSRGRDPLLAVHASMGMVHIDPARAAAVLTGQLIGTTSWPVREVVNILQDARTEASAAMLGLLEQVDEALLPRLLQVMEGLRVPLPGRAILRLLQHRSVDVQIGVLRIVTDPSTRPIIVAMLSHEDWRVRMHAAKALGRVGRREDVPALTVLLSDREWWVRYRSAQVLASLPFLKVEDLRAIAQATRDRYAGDMLRQVLAESKVAA